MKHILANCTTCGNPMTNRVQLQEVMTCIDCKVKRMNNRAIEYKKVKRDRLKAKEV